MHKGCSEQLAAQARLLLETRARVEAQQENEEVHERELEGESAEQ